MLDYFPYLKKSLKSIYSLLQGLPPISESEITKELILKYVGKKIQQF
jgi:hypothetical protein